MNERDFWNALIVAFGGTGGASNEQEFRTKLVAAVEALSLDGIAAQLEDLDDRVTDIENSA
jgi:hypothetical protein